MLSKADFVRHSLELHLFFDRIMKEHSLFLEAGFAPKDVVLAQQADAFKTAFDLLLRETVNLSFGVVRTSVLRSGEVVTANTLPAEIKTSQLSGIPIDTALTRLELNLVGDGQTVSDALYDRVYDLNRRTIALTGELARFKSIILEQVLACNLYTHNFPSMIHHILEEAEHYIEHLNHLQEGRMPDIRTEAKHEEVFWNDIMKEHSLFIRQLLDPAEAALIKQANTFAKRFASLEKEAEQTSTERKELCEVTEESLEETIRLRNFKVQATIGLLQCRIRSLIIPLLADHVTREANHYIRVLRELEAEIPCNR